MLDAKESWSLEQLPSYKQHVQIQIPKVILLYIYPQASLDNTDVKEKDKRTSTKTKMGMAKYQSMWSRKTAKRKTDKNILLVHILPKLWTTNPRAQEFISELAGILSFIQVALNHVRPYRRILGTHQWTLQCVPYQTTDIWHIKHKLKWEDFVIVYQHLPGVTINKGNSTKLWQLHLHYTRERQGLTLYSYPSQRNNSNCSRTNRIK